jgi:hypothetical protein
MKRLAFYHLPMLVTMLSSIIGPASVQAIPPPQNTLWAKVKYTVGVTPGVEVGDLIDKTGGIFYVVPIKVNDTSQAVAVASIMKLSQTIGRITVTVQVTDGQGQAANPVTPTSPEQLADLVRKALSTNPLFKDVVVKAAGIGPRKRVFPVFSKSVIQFPNDDLSDLYGNFNGVAAAVFQDVLVTEAGGYSLAASTAE